MAYSYSRKTASTNVVQQRLTVNRKADKTGAAAA